MKRFIKETFKKNPLIHKLVVNHRLKKKQQLAKKYYESQDIDNKTIIFSSFYGREYSDSPRAIYEEMINDSYFDDYTFIWSFKEPEKYREIKELERAILIKNVSEEFFKCMYKSKYWVSNSRMYPYIEKRSEQILIQTWHGTPLKKIGCDIDVDGNNARHAKNELNNLYIEDAIKYDYMPSPSKYYSQCIKSAFRIDDTSKIHEIGYPRNDILKKYNVDKINEIKEKFNIDKKRKVIAYVPTWRDNKYQNGEYISDLEYDFFDYLKKELSDEYILIYRTHYFIANDFKFNKYSDFIVNGRIFEDINDLYLISDMLITDYSSAFFDYANLNRKMIFYMYDYEEYKNKTRNFYLDIDALPGNIVKTKEALVKEINNDNFDINRVEKFNNEYNYLEDGYAAKRLVDDIFK